MLNDVDKEFYLPTEDENGEPIETNVYNDVYEEEEEEVEHDDEFYEANELKATDEQEIDTTAESEEQFNEASEQLKEIYTAVLASGFITEEQLTEIEVLNAQVNEAYDDILGKEKTDIEKLKDRVEELKEGFVGASPDEILNILTENGTKCWLYKDDDDNVLIDGTSIPELTMLVQKLNLIATDGDDESSITITPTFIELIAKSDIKLSAKQILINGLLGGSGWQVDEEGNLDINDLNVRGNISCDSINVNNLISAGIPNALTQDMSIKVNSDETISQYLDEIPWNLNGFNVSITLNANITENLELRRFQNGVITIYLNGYILKGYIRGTFNGAVYNIYGGNSASDKTNIGAIKPAIQYDNGAYKFSLYLTHCRDVMIKNVKIYGKPVSGFTNSAGIGIDQKSNVTLSNVEFIDCDHILRASYISQVFCVSSKGVANRNGWTASTGAQIFLGSVTQAGGKNANTYTSNNGQVYSNGVTFDAVQSDEKNDNTETTIPTVVKYEIFKPKYCDSYRSTVYNNWKNDGVARQGDWGYGDMNGCAFYGTQFEAVKGKDITKVTIQVTRSSNCGNSASVSHTFQAHTHSGRPPGMPSYTACNKTLSLAWGESGIATITDSTILAGIKAGTIKGFGIKSAYDKSHYSALTNWTVRIYYRE